jgi:hypothetical protein
MRRKNTVQPGRPQMTIRGMRFACWITRATHPHSDYVITFQRQQRLREPALMLRNTYISSLISYRLVFTPEIWSILIILIPCTVHLLLFCTMTNKCTQLFHKLSHCYTFRRYRVIRRELVVNTLQSYTSIWHSEDRASWYILIINANEMQYFSNLFW